MRLWLLSMQHYFSIGILGKWQRTMEAREVALADYKPAFDTSGPLGRCLRRTRYHQWIRVNFDHLRRLAGHRETKEDMVMRSIHEGIPLSYQKLAAFVNRPLVPQPRLPPSPYPLPAANSAPANDSDPTTALLNSAPSTNCRYWPLCGSVLRQNPPAFQTTLYSPHSPCLNTGNKYIHLQPQQHALIS